MISCPSSINNQLLVQHFSALPLQAERLTIARSVPAGFISESCLKCIAAVWDRFYFTFSSFGNLLYAFLMLFGSFFKCEFRPSPDGLPITPSSRKGVNPGHLFNSFWIQLETKSRSGGQRESICDRLREEKPYFFIPCESALWLHHFWINVEGVFE